MRVLSGKRGFSLVELLTVIAIIAILAAIIFPVMNSVKDRAKMTNCMTNLMNIQNAIKMYRLDNRAFPDTLAVQYQAGIPFDQASPLPSEKTCFKDQIKSAGAYRCPSSPVTDYNLPVTVGYPVPYGAGPETDRALYAVDSYDTQTNMSGTNVQIRYCLKWARDTGEVAAHMPYPPSVPDTPDLQAADFERQLRFKNPPDDTVITWCTYHKGGSGLVLFLDGHVDRMPNVEIGQCLWRIRPKKL